MNQPRSNEKSYQCPTGPLAWLNDIEISKAPYLTSFLLLAVNMYLIGQPFFAINIPYTDSVLVALREVKELYIFWIAAIILGAISIIALIIPMIKFFEWKYRWFTPVVATSAIELAAVVFMVSQKNNLLENTLIGYAYQLFSIDINLTATAWLFIALNVALAVCSIKMLIDIKNNVRTY